MRLRPALVGVLDWDGAAYKPKREGVGEIKNKKFIFKDVMGKTPENEGGGGSGMDA